MFTFDETKAILKNPSVHGAMMAVVYERAIVAPRNPPPWPYNGKLIPTGPFILFRASVEAAVRIALERTQGRDRERLLILLRMAEGDDAELIIHALGLVCEEYAVTMQHGHAGIESWRGFNNRS